MQAIDLLCKGKTDTELLATLVAALVDNEDDLVAKLRQQTGYAKTTVANIEVLAAIVEVVKPRLHNASSAAMHGANGDNRAVISE